MTSSPPRWWTKTKHLSLASFVRSPEVVLLSILLFVSLEVDWKPPIFHYLWLDLSVLKGP